MFKVLFIAIFMALLAAAGTAQAQGSPQFIFPLACTLGTDCWSVNYIDVDPGEGAAQDFSCGAKTYDGHKGTDYALRSLAEMEQGVDVLAAKDGKVLRLRDGETDTVKSEEDLDLIKKARKECGNAVLLDHGSGLRTMYCHLKKGSLVVARDDQVKAGQKIAQAGHSGLAEFPHLHFGVLWEGGVVDPYTGMLNTEGCGQMKQSLWAEGQPLTYEPFALYDAGFRGAVPDFEAIKRGEKNPVMLESGSAALVFWGAIYGAAAGDEITLEIHDPEGQIFTSRNLVQEKTRARQYYYTGRSLQGKTLKPGTYTGTARLKRSGLKEKILRRTVTVR